MGDWIDLFTERQLIDDSLSPKGIVQCQIANKYAKEIDYRTVFVSPMRRTIQTAMLIFEDHPNIRDNKLNFIVHPHLRERLNASCDIPSINYKEMFQKLRREYFDIEMDWSLVEVIKRQDKWYLDNLIQEC